MITEAQYIPYRELRKELSVEIRSLILRGESSCLVVQVRHDSEYVVRIRVVRMRRVTEYPHGKDSVDFYVRSRNRLSVLYFRDEVLELVGRSVDVLLDVNRLRRWEYRPRSLLVAFCVGIFESPTYRPAVRGIHREVDVRV